MSVREYAILYTGVRLAGGATALGGNAILDAPPHALDGPEHTGSLPIERLSTADLDTTMVASPDGAGGVAFLRSAFEPVTDEFTALGGSPETFSLTRLPLFTRRVWVQSLRVAEPDVGGNGATVAVTTTAADIVTIDYEAIPEDDMTKRYDVALDYTDIPNDLDEFTLYVPAIGDLVDIRIRPDTFVPFTGGAIDAWDFIALGRHAAEATDYQAYLGPDLAGQDSGDSVGAAGYPERYLAGSQAIIAGDYCPDTDPIIAAAIYHAHGPATAGHADLIILVTKAP